MQDVLDSIVTQVNRRIAASEERMERRFEEVIHRFEEVIHRLEVLERERQQQRQTTTTGAVSSVATDPSAATPSGVAPISLLDQPPSSRLPLDPWLPPLQADQAISVVQLLVAPTRVIVPWSIDSSNGTGVEGRSSGESTAAVNQQQ